MKKKLAVVPRRLAGTYRPLAVNRLPRERPKVKTYKNTLSKDRPGEPCLCWSFVG